MHISDALYNKGRVLWKVDRVAVWDEGKGEMKLLGRVAEWQGDFNKLMGVE